MSNLLVLPFHRPTLPPPHSFDGQTVLITGANTGVGREAARHAINLGASKIIMGVRNVSKGEAAKDDIRRTTGAASDAIEVWPLEMGSFDSVKSFAARAEKHVKEGGRLDVAIMNAGLATGLWEQTSDGWEKTIQVNCLSTALLSLKLLPLLKQSKSDTSNSHPGAIAVPHLVIVASDIHQMAKFSERNASNILQALNDKKLWEKTQSVNPLERYAVSKLLDHYITIELANMVAAKDGALPQVIVNCVTPGFCKSQLMSRGEKAPLILRFLQWLVARDVVDGSKTFLDAAMYGVDSHGKYLENEIITHPGKIVTDPDCIKARKQIWQETLNVLGDVDADLDL
ncbi:putative short-chain dehydrogenase [Exophiala viscosa]|uniref:Short-chain dehydrogenase n=1 Tax=Exophiala viscosa TaxID=2486360 RepID=A0AAN6E684_9EURO|nr:putative short-chain dehydrogenase [Exophiala viscosa]